MPAPRSPRVPPVAASRHQADSAGETGWVFGYGSLVWRPAFNHAEMAPGFVRGFTRRFWQGSTDHRGVPGAPGRVVTLLPGDPLQDRVWGVAYRLPEETAGEILAALDVREQGGYERLLLDVELKQGAVRALTYVATADNPEYLGPAALPAIAKQVVGSQGPSGANADYVLELERALVAMGADDSHVFALADLVRGELASLGLGDELGEARR